MLKIAIVGAESSGKTTLAKDLAADLGGSYLPEYAREYFQAKGDVAYTLADVIAIAQGQLSGEAEAARWQRTGGADWLVCDTNALVCKIWAEVRYGYCPAAITACWQPMSYLLHILPRPDIAWQADPLREHPHDRDVLFALYETALQTAGVPYCVVGGAREARVAAVRAALRTQMGC
ncbi:ATP-binding protein [Chitinimonas arctica]|uniref:ATP-binding protein n=1 Tax=Chitinimonas arctica TaxID=2594795 RepID=A0A516SCA0_9NEIS|nr:ATP-binding protein [Chitinimonas arctica]QDQ25779.1 ATP-binding protein [Chitinimonas arctica]